MERVRFFAGQLLSVDDLTTEQNYFLDKQRRQNLQSLGAGIVSGLQVSISGGNEVHVSPGVAIDPFGNEIVVDQIQVLPTPTGVTSAIVGISYKELPTKPVSAGSTVEFSRIQDSFDITILEANGESADSITLARVSLSEGQWQKERKSFASLIAFAGIGIFLAWWLTRSQRRC